MAKNHLPSDAPQRVADETSAPRSPQGGGDEDRSAATLSAIRAAAERARQDLKLASPLSEAGGDDLAFLRGSLTGYEVLACLYQGGQGSVYKALRKSSGEQVAIKILLDGPLASPRAKHRFAREIELIARIDHPNIVRVLESGTVRDRHFFAMEYIEGYSIPDYALLHRCSLADRLRLMVKVCSAVSYAHQKGIIHRDLKPGNILVDEEGEPHILDFGLAKLLPGEQAGSAERLTMTGHVVGTLPFLAPECVIGPTDDADVRADIYALGVILFHLITGTYPFPVHGSNEAVRRSIVQREPRTLKETVARDQLDDAFDPRDINDDLEVVVAKALEKDKQHRYQSANALGDDLNRLLNGEAVQAKADRRFYMLRKALRRYRVHAAVAVMFLLVLIGSLIATSMAWRRADWVARAAQAGLQMGSFLKFGQVRQDDGRIDQAIKMYEQALEIGEPYSDSLIVRLAMFAAHYELAQSHIQEKQPKLARPHVVQALTLADTLQREDFGGINQAIAFDTTDSPAQYIQSRVARAFLLKGRLASIEAQFEEGASDLERSVAIFREIATARGEDPADWKYLGNALAMLGHCYRKTGKYAKSLASYRENYEIIKRLVTQFPDNVDHSISYCYALNHMIAWHIDQRTPEDYAAAMAYILETEARIQTLNENMEAQSRARDIRRIVDAAGRNRKIISSRRAAAETTPNQP